jgi:thioredoxin reductase (NADPH)
MLELIFLEGNQRGHTVRLNFDRAWFGRQPTCDFVLEGDDTSRVHFSIEKRGADYILVDNRSKNGTLVNGIRVDQVAIKPGDDIVAGNNRMQVREFASFGHLFRFVIQRASDENGSQVIVEDNILLGRKSICQVQLNDPAVAAVHAEIEKRVDGIWITDKSSGAGVYVNGQRVVSQQINSGDVITIRPFEITVSLTEEICFLGIRDHSEELQADQAEVPGQYRDVVVAPPHAEGGKARPSESISALPHWLQAKAPIWVPTSDILPNRFRTLLLALFLVGVLGWGAVAFAKKWNTAYSPGPLTEAHAGFGCDSCHGGFKGVPDSQCAACHADEKAGTVHAANHVACVGCHSEHRGEKFDMARDVGAGCQSAGCHVTVHAPEKAILAKQAPPEPGLKVPTAVALGVHFEGGDAMHDKHANLKAACASCHTNGDPGLLEVNAKQPAIRAKELKDIRMRCLGCHGFGPEATLGERCYSCHVEHPGPAAKAILTPAQFSNTAPTHPALALSPNRISGILVFIGALCVVPLFFFAATAGNVRVKYARFRGEIQNKVRSTPAVPHSAPDPSPQPDVSPVAPVGAAESKSTDNQNPTGTLRPQINLELCVGCGTCVHVCPFNVLEIVNEKAIAARLEDCTGFAACAAECPTEAIVLVAGGAMQTVELPIYDPDLETNVPGLYLAGEVTGKALIKVAINQGKKVVDSIMKNRPQPCEHYDVIVVGAGPAGTSTALAAHAEGLKVLVLEQGTQANTIRNFPRQKFVMAEPVIIPVYGPLWMEDTSKESLLERWQEIIRATDLKINEDEKVLHVVQKETHFLVQSSKGEYQGTRVVLAVGKRGSPRKLGVPGEESTKVAYSLLDADAFQGKSICIVGGGDSGIEAACGLGRADLGNKISLVHRLADFGRAKPRNQKKIKKNMDEGRIKVFFTAAVTEIRDSSILIKTGETIEEVQNDFVFVMVGGESPNKFLTECGIGFSKRALG